MSEKTQVNPNINATQINPNVNNATAVNTEINAFQNDVKIGTVLGGKYKITQPLSSKTGEADIYICEYQGKKYAAKIYRRQTSVKKEVIEALRYIDSQHIAKLYETGLYNGRTYEIITYFRNGSLQGKRFTLDGLKKTIIPSVNEALRVLHDTGTIHKDLKPSNIMYLNNYSGVALIDFGISSVVDEGNTVLVTKTGMTPEYSAPETFRGLFLEESDYYSFGITLYELFCGKTPYKNMSPDEIARFTSIQRIPFPADMPQELIKLILGLTYYDITNRNDPSNPNRRWTFNEVDNWLKGIDQPVPGESKSQAADTIPAYTFLKKKYYDTQSLTEALAVNWKDGKRQLYRGLLSGFFKGVNPEVADYCMDAEEEANNRSKNEDVIFWNLLYRINPDLSGFYWCGRSYSSVVELGNEMLEKLWANDMSDESFWQEILVNKLLSSYLSNTNSQNQSLKNAVNALESSFWINKSNKREQLVNYYTMAYLLSGKRVFCTGGKKMNDVSELTAYMKELLDSSYERFETFCHSMIDYDNTLDAQLEAWLIALGKRNELEQWRKSHE